MTQFEEVDITNETRAIIHCMDANRMNYGVSTIIDILRGAKNQKILSKGLNQNPEYGTLSQITVARLRQIIQELMYQGYLELSGDQYPVIQTTRKSAEFQQNNRTFVMKLAKEKEQEEVSGRKQKRGSRKKAGAAAMLSEKDLELFETLRVLRREIAGEEKVPPYMIFSDKTLALMSAAHPENLEEMLRISGVGEFKLQKYGERFLQVIRR